MKGTEVLDRINVIKTDILAELRKVIIGQDDVVEKLLISIFSKGHCLLMGVPGLAKTLMVSTLAQILDLDFNRVQFTPDLMPSDITGTEILEEETGTNRRYFKFIKGPIFSNIVLADEINRTPPKTQAALLQAMQEKEVTVGGETYKLAQPFFVLATQNPIEQEGTYPLPEAQLDRFMFNIKVDYPTFEEEIAIVSNTTGDYKPNTHKILSAKEIVEMQHFVMQVPVAESVVRFAVEMAASSRPQREYATDFVNQYVGWGAGPRASQYLIIGAKAKALLDGKNVPDIEDVTAIAKSVLRHRIIPNFNAEANGITADDVIDSLIKDIKSKY